MIENKGPTDMAEPGHCAMRDTCGTKGWFGDALPCPYSGPAVEVRHN